MLYFHNQGEIDIRGATVAGLSAKDGDTPIGFFGTGLKYSIACILRWGGEITIYSGTTAHVFTSETVEFRGKQFDQICHNGQHLGFTTEYGKNWEPWQVFRELYANARDEGGSVSNVMQPVAAGSTLIVVDCAKLQAEYTNRDTIILPEMEYAHSNSTGRVASSPSSYIYYRGVRVMKFSCALTYNIIESLDLTEDRTVTYLWSLQDRIGALIQALPSEELVLSALTAHKDQFESDLGDFRPYLETSPAFIAVAKRLYKQDPRRWDVLKRIIEKHAAELLAPTLITLSPLRQKMLDRASAFCERMGYEISWPIHVADLGASYLGQWNQATGTIYLSPVVFDQGTKQLVSTLYEELTHAHTGKTDCNYDMQMHLFNTIVSLYEEHVFGEPI